jgi:hypothetical protein
MSIRVSADSPDLLIVSCICIVDDKLSQETFRGAGSAQSHRSKMCQRAIAGRDEAVGDNDNNGTDETSVTFSSWNIEFGKINACVLSGGKCVSIHC